MTCPTCGFDEGPVGVDEAGNPLTCADTFHVPRTFWAFGTVIRVDPVTNPTVPQPDDRRWMVLVAAHTSANRQWALMALDSGYISHWASMYGWLRVEE